jgi:fermentation-respiration switch protein FrsA (DUF1100 family)
MARQGIIIYTPGGYVKVGDWHEPSWLVWQRKTSAYSSKVELFITGDVGEDAYRRAAEPKELFIVRGAGQVGLYDRADLIPWDRLASFFTQHLR